jgi:hypothetical protein
MLRTLESERVGRCIGVFTPDFRVNLLICDRNAWIRVPNVRIPDLPDRSATPCMAALSIFRIPHGSTTMETQ